MGTKRRNRRVSIRREQGQLLTAARADQTNSVVFKKKKKSITKPDINSARFKFQATHERCVYTKYLCFTLRGLTTAHRNCKYFLHLEIQEERVFANLTCNINPKTPGIYWARQKDNRHSGVGCTTKVKMNSQLTVCPPHTANDRTFLAVLNLIPETSLTSAVVIYDH